MPLPLRAWCVCCLPCFMASAHSEQACVHLLPSAMGSEPLENRFHCALFTLVCWVLSMVQQNRKPSVHIYWQKHEHRAPVDPLRARGGSINVNEHWADVHQRSWIESVRTISTRLGGQIPQCETTKAKFSGANHGKVTCFPILSFRISNNN